MSSINIAGRKIGAGCPCYCIAEMSANHGQSLDRARELVFAAKEAGADAVKLQTYTPDTITIDNDTEEFKVGAGSLWEGKKLYALYKEAFTPWEWQAELKELANNLGMACFSTPFDSTAVEFLEDLKMPAYKISSFEIVDLQLIRAVARTGKPAIISTGMASLVEIREAVAAFRGAGGGELALLKCTSAYPSPPEDMNLHTIPHLAASFGVPIGLSDHTLELPVPVAAVALGACIVEKHFTLSRSEPGPDSAFSLEPAEFKATIQAIRTAERALGEISYEVAKQESSSRVFRRSLYVVTDMKAGDLFTRENLRSIRPGYGLPPKFFESVLGKQAATPISRGTPLRWDLIK